MVFIVGFCHSFGSARLTAFISGPNWIHGAGENPIMEIADATETVVHDPEGHNLLVSRDGQLVSEDVATKISEFMWATIGEAFEYSNAHGDIIPPERSLFDYFQEKLEQTQFSQTEKKMCLDSCRLWGAYVGDPIERQSLKFFRLEECVDGSEYCLILYQCDESANVFIGNYFVASTYKRILAHVAKSAQMHVDIQLNQPVVRIEAPPRDNSHPGQHQVTVSTAAGEQYTFDEVVVTCPLGWLKRNTDAFVPPLPDRLLQAISNISYGRLEKAYVTFPRAFWHDTANDNTNGSSQATKSPVFTQFLEPSYTDYPHGIEWNQECLSLASLPDKTAQPTLLFYTYGPCSTHIVSKIADLDPSSPEYKDTLIGFLKPFYARLPGYHPTSPDCVPSAILATRWQTDPYAGNGSYCNFQVGLTQADKDIEALRSCVGVGEGRGLWFAGEHTAPFVALGTTTGAYWSGERAAMQVCQKWGLGSVGASGVRDDSLPSAGRK